MKNLVEYILENELQPAVTVFYRANIGKMNYNNYKNTGQSIGDVTELSYKYYSDYRKSFIYGEQSGKDWTFALEIKSTDNNSLNNFKKYLADKNKNDEFYQYFIDKKDAIKAAYKAKNEYENKKWTLNTLLSAIKKDRDLRSLNYDYYITKNSSQVENSPIESIYVSSSWRITVVNNRIHVERAGWHTYEVPNLASLYKVLSANSDNDEDETQRCEYSIRVYN